MRQLSHSDVCMRFDPALARLFSGSPFYCTTPMPNWRVKQDSERMYGDIRLLLRLNVLVRCGRKKSVD
jgi:hypothetical protein